MKIVANALGERAVLKLMYAALIRASETWRGVLVNPFELEQLGAIGAELDAEHARRLAPMHAKTKSEGVSPSRKSSKNRTWPVRGGVGSPRSISDGLGAMIKSD